LTLVYDGEIAEYIVCFADQALLKVMKNYANSKVSITDIAAKE
jgi:hypothetical protein